MKNRDKSALLRTVAASVCLIVAGFVLLLNPDLGSAAVAAIVGWVLTGLGAFGVLVCLLSWPVFGFLEIVLSILALGTGIYLLCEPLALASILGVCLGVYLAVQGAGALNEAWKLRKANVPCLANFVLAVLMLILGAVLVFSPLTTSRLIMGLCGLALLLCGTVNLVVRARAAKHLREDPSRARIIDADE